MLNTYTKLTTNNKTFNTIKVNAVSGGIYKTYKESWFERFHLQSERAKVLLLENRETYNYNYNDLIILQMVICGDMEVMVEIIRAEDLDKYLTNEKDD